MAKSIVIVESPTKVKTINKILGDSFKVVSSMGHLIDLPKSKLGVDMENNFQPDLIVVRSKQKTLSQLKKDAKNAKAIYFATDPDREGEAIGWNLKNHIGEGKKIYRVTFQEITKEAVLKAFQSPREFDAKLIDAQIARRILDRIVGYKISPILWKKVGSRLSAGRVQSVALRLIVERERSIKAFVPQEYWQIAADLKKDKVDQTLTAQLEKIKDQKVELKNKQETDRLVEDIQKQSFVVHNISEREGKRNPNPPFITSTMQQEAFNKLRFNANKTMMFAQELYEGIELEGGEPVGLITYMRTDSVNIANEAMDKVRGFIQKSYGKDFLPDQPNKYKSKKRAQEAHEAIRPSDVERTPESVKSFLSDDQYKLYELIWRRFVSSQMTPAVYLYKKIEIQAGPYGFSASGSNLIFEGYKKVFQDDDEEKEDPVDFTQYQKDDLLKLLELKPTQHFTKPPPRYSDASLVKALEENGIGRPSTYASIISTLIVRNYIIRERGYLSPTELGISISDLLVKYFVKVMDIGFTAKMEENLDRVEEGDLDYPQLLKEFYAPFKEELDFAENNMEKTETFIDKKCPLCNRQMVIKWGRRGQFLSCSGFPECKHAEPITTGVKCPEENCGGELVKRRSTRGSFFGCSNYPKCTYITKELPAEETS